MNLQHRCYNSYLLKIVYYYCIINLKTKIMEVNINTKKTPQLITIPAVIIFGGALLFMVYNLFTLIW